MEWSIILCIFLFQSLYFWILPPNFLDEGIWLELTRWVSEGFKPYSDFPTVYGPFYLRILSEVVSLLGGKLIHLRIFMGCIQGLACFLLLRWTVRDLLNKKVAFFICLLCAFSIANPGLDATMFWGLRYYSALILIMPLLLEMLSLIQLSSRSRNVIFLLWSFLFFYSGEAGIIAAPVLTSYLIFLRICARLTLKSIFKLVGWGALGIVLCVLVLREEAFLYARELLIYAPVTYRDMGFPYPKIDFKTLHFFFPFVVLASALLFSFFLPRNQSLVLWGIVLSLIPALKVATSRSDSVHLGYAYPFVILLTAAMIHIGYYRFHKQRIRVVWTTSWLVALVFCLFEFTSINTFNHMKNIFASVQSSNDRMYNSQWGIWMPKEKFLTLKEATTKTKEQTFGKNGRLFVFPFQQILYSELGIKSLFIEPMQPCSLKANRADCIREFNNTHPDFVLRVPEGTLYSWPFDGYYSGFEYPEAFETLYANFKNPRSLGPSGWLLYERNSKRPSNTSIPYFRPLANDLNYCNSEAIKCDFLDSATSSLRLAKKNSLMCLTLSKDSYNQAKQSFGVELSREIISTTGVAISWVCKETDTSNCVCSRVRVRSTNDHFYGKWSWTDFANWSTDDISRIRFFGNKLNE